MKLWRSRGPFHVRWNRFKAATMSVTWLLESDVFPSSHAELQRAIEQLGHNTVAWDDSWWTSGRWPSLPGSAVVFHGSLENASRIHASGHWTPGAYCDTPTFSCSNWYPAAEKWLLHQAWRCLPADEFVAHARAVVSEFQGSGSVFVRPDSPLKPFSGCVLSSDSISLRALDHGFYFDDPSLPVIVAPVQAVGREWRCVVVNRQVVAGSAYEADGRLALPDEPCGEPWMFASQIAAELPQPEAVYVLDLCEVNGDLRLLELNPFSGADLYGCQADNVVRAVSGAATQKLGE